jgi:hypothetical protein
MTADNQIVELVSRSVVPVDLQYAEYREYLRYDFFYSCAYCTIGESEASGIAFTIDHYEPRTKNPSLLNDYGNLIYCCNPCNTYKSSRAPSQQEQSKGYRFFRPDTDVFEHHFQKKDLLLEEKSPVGFYTLHAVNLNRQQLRRLRKLRHDLFECEKFVLGGVLALRKFKLDQLPQEVKGRALRAINLAIDTQKKISHSIDDLLRTNAHSALVDKDVEAKLSAKERREKLKHLDAVVAGRW